MKKKIVTMMLFMTAVTIVFAADYEKGIQKGIEMLNNAKTSQAAVDAANYFERVAEANKSEWLPLYYAAYSSLSAGYQQEKRDMKDEWYQKGIAFIQRAKAIRRCC